MGKSKSIEEILKSWSKYDRPQDGQRFVHYKGGEYEIVTTGFMEATEVPCVVYRSLLKNIVWVRTAENFLEKVEYDGTIVQRFAPSE